MRIFSITEAADVQAYQKIFPQGRHSAAAARRLLSLTPAAAASALLPAAPAALAAVTVAAHVPALSLPPPVPMSEASSLGALRELNTEVAAERERSERVAKEATYRLIDEISRQEAEATEQPPGQLWRNAFGISVGDRWRWSVTDRLRNELVSTVFLRVDRMEPDGSLRGHDGRTELDARGNFIALPAARGLPTEHWLKPQQVADLAELPEGSSCYIEAVLDFAIGRVSLNGTAQRRGMQWLKLKACDFDAVRVDLRLAGGGGSTGGRFARHQLLVCHRLGPAAGLGAGRPCRRPH